MFKAELEVGEYHWCRAQRVLTPKKSIRSVEYDERFVTFVGPDYRQCSDGDTWLLAKTGRTWTYEPFSETPNLYLELAQLRLRRGDIEYFANHYGDRGAGAQELELGEKTVRATSVEGWRPMVMMMRRLVSSFQKGDPTRLIVDRLNHHIRSSLVITVNVDMATPAAQPKLEFGIPNMRSVVLMQFAQLVADQRTLGICKHCQKIFEAKPKRNHVREYCSDSCKMKFHRRKKRDE